MAGIGFADEWTEVSDLMGPHRAFYVSSMRQAQLGILKAALVAYVLFTQLGFSAAQSLFSWICIAMAVVALIGTFMNQWWARIPVTLLAAVVIADCALSVFYSVKIGYFSHARTVPLIVELVEDVLICLIAADCCYVSYRYVGKPRVLEA